MGQTPSTEGVVLALSAGRLTQHYEPLTVTSQSLRGVERVRYVKRSQRWFGTTITRRIGIVAGSAVIATRRWDSLETTPS